MDSRDVLKKTLSITNMVVQAYLADMTDEDLLVSVRPGCNPIAYQLGHLIASGCDMLEGVKQGSAPRLPDGFKARYAPDQTGEKSGFLTKAEYLDLLKKVDDAVVQVIDSMSDIDMDQPSHESVRAWFPTQGQVLVLLVTHSLMHAGQWVVVRRELGKPVVM